MARLTIVVAFVLCLAGTAEAAYDHGSGGVVSPTAVAADGGTDYSVSLSGKPAVVDIVLVLDNSGSMLSSFGGPQSKWDALDSASKTFVNELKASGFFDRGGKVGLAFSATGTTTVPTSDVTTIDTAIDSASPGGSACISCGLQQATELLTGIAGSSGHKRIAYLFADGENAGTTPTVQEVVDAANAAGVQRRVIGIGSEASGKGLEAYDSDGTVPYPTNAIELKSAYEAEPTNFPGATSISWAFHLTPGFTASPPTVSKGTTTVAGQDVTWTIPSLGEESATLSFHATHSASSGCAASALLTGTTFSDAEGDAGPAVGLGPLSLSGCPAPAGQGGQTGTTPGPTAKPGATIDPSKVIPLPKPSSGCTSKRSLAFKVRPPRGTSVTKVTVKVTGIKAKTYKGKSAKSKIQLSGLPNGSYSVKVKVTLSDGRTTSLTQRYRTCGKA
jgi:hypothetical protein